MSPNLPSAHDGSRKPSGRSFEKWIHQFYHRGAGVKYFVTRRLRPAGIALGLVFLLITCLGIGHGREPIYQVFSLCLGMTMIGVPWAIIRQASVEAKRELPRFGTAGESLRYTVQVSNRSKRHLKRAWLFDTPPDPLREPGEEERNAFDRKFAYFRWQWILLGNRLFSDGSSREELMLKRGASARVTIDIIPLRRGVIYFDDLRVVLPDPFGLFQRCRKVKTSAATLTVLPRRFPLPKIELPGGAAFKFSGQASTNAVGNSGEFVGLRDYRPGDPLRQIHWKSWARTGRPIVKELEDTYYPRYGLVVDTLSTERTDDRFEEVISVAASFAASIDTSDSLLDMMFIKSEAHMVTAGGGMERAEKLLEVLAAVSPERTEDYENLSRLIINHSGQLTSCLIIFNGWSSEKAGFLKSLTSRGIICAPIIIGNGPATSGTPGHWLETSHVARDLLRLPSKLSATI